MIPNTILSILPISTVNEAFLKARRARGLVYSEKQRFKDTSYVF